MAQEGKVKTFSCDDFHSPAGPVYYEINISYPIGNTRKYSITEHIWTSKDQHLDLLFLACGDVRNVLSTISELSQRKPNYIPKSVDIHLNDNDPMIMPRDVLLLDIITQMNPNVPDDLDFLWNVWYNIALSQKHYERLQTVINSLVDKVSSELDGARLGFLDAKSKEHCLKVWKEWLNLELGLEKIVQERENISSIFGDVEDELHEKIGLGICEETEFVKSVMKRLRKEIDHWCKNRSTTDDNDVMNPTLGTPFSLKRSIDPDSCPFKGFLPIDRDDIKKNESLTGICKAILKNWIQKFQRFKMEHSLMVYFWFGDCLALCSSGFPKEMLFDVIDTGNVGDYVGLINVLVCCEPRLRRAGKSLLRTSSMKIWQACRTAQEYYDKCIGIDSNLLPSVLGLYLAVDFDLGTRWLPDEGVIGDDILFWVKAEPTRTSLWINKESDITTALWSLAKRCFVLQEEYYDVEGYLQSSPLTLLRIIHKLSPVVQGGAKTLVDRLESEIPYDFYQVHGFTWKLIKAAALGGGEPIVEVEVQIKRSPLTHEAMMPKAIFLRHKYSLKELFRGTILLNTIRLNHDQSIVKFHMLEKDWEAVKKDDFKIQIGDSHPQFQVLSAGIAHDLQKDCISCTVVDDLQETFGLIDCQRFQDHNQLNTILDINKVEEDECVYRAELRLIDLEKCNAKDMKVDFVPEAFPVQVDIRFGNELGAQLKFSCPIRPSSSSFKLSKKQKNLVCSIKKAKEMTTGEMALRQPAHVPLHAMPKWINRPKEEILPCYARAMMFRTPDGIKARFSKGESTSPICRVRKAIEGMMLITLMSQNSCVVFHHGLTEKPSPEDNDTHLIKVYNKLLKWNYVPYMECLVCDLKGANEKVRRFNRLELLECSDMRHIKLSPEELRLLRKMMNINTERTEQNPKRGDLYLWRNSFICPIYPREGLINQCPANAFERMIRKEVIESLIGPRMEEDDDANDDSSELLDPSCHDDQNKELLDPSCFDDQNKECCAFCQKRSQNLKKCMRCKQISYCDRKCQKNHWKKHKHVCKKSVPSSHNSSTMEDGDSQPKMRFLSSDSHDKVIPMQVAHSPKDPCGAVMETTDENDDENVCYHSDDKDAHGNQDGECCDECNSSLEVVLKQCKCCKKLFFLK